MTFNQTNRRGLTKEQLHDLDLAQDTQRPAGRYIVELQDARTGKTHQRVSVNNYITPLYDRIVRWYQGAFFQQKLRYVHQNAATVSFPPHLVFGGDRPPLKPIECMVGTDSVLPEDTASSWATGSVVGWGVRWKGTVPASGPRGQINELQSELALNTIKLVWDFNENQGNGDYGSLAIARINHPTNYNTTAPTGATIRDWPVIGLPGQWPKFPVTDPNTGVSSRQRPVTIIGMDDTYIYVISQRLSTSTTHRIYRFPLAGYSSGPYVLTPPAFEAVTSGDLASFQSVTNTSESTGVFNANTGMKLGFYGSNLLIAWADYTGSLRLGQWTTAGARVGTDLIVSSTDPASPENTGVGSFGCGLVVIGTKAYITGRGHANIYRVELTTMTVDATIPIPGSTLVQLDMCSDGTDLFVGTYKGIFKLTTAGVYLDCYGHPFAKPWSETGQAPWSTGANGQRMQGPWEREIESIFYESSSYDRQTGFGTPYDNGGSPQFSIGEYSDTSTFTNDLFYSNGVLYGGRRMTDATSVSGGIPSGGVYPLIGQNCISRKTLDSPVSKTSSSTMKWTYSLTLPTSWSEIPAMVSPPS